MDFGEFAGLDDGELDVVVGALLIAKDAYPDLDPAARARELGNLAHPLEGRGVALASPLEQALALSDLLYGREGFRGNADDYYDPRNSYLNEVLDRRVGIPITLAIIYAAVARRVGVRASGVGFPGHFLIRIDSQHGSVFVDPFDGGRVLDKSGLAGLWQRVQGTRGEVLPHWLEPATPRATLSRLLLNLKGIYASRGDFSHLLVVLDRMLELTPDSPAELRDRGLVAARLGAPRAAIADLERYLERAPGSGDVAEVRRILGELTRRGPSSLN